MKKLKNKGIILFLLAAVALYIAIYVVPSVPGFFDKTYVAEFGELTVFDEEPGYFVRSETVYLADASGNVRRLVDEDTLLRAGTPAVEVTTGGEPEEIPEDLQTAMDRFNGKVVRGEGYRVAEGGLVSFFFDGYEGVLDLEQAEKSRYGFFSSIGDDCVVKLSGENVKEGYPVFKSIRNDIWYLVLYVSQDHLERYRVGRRVYVSVDRSEEETSEVEMRVYSAAPESDKGKIILYTDNYLPRLGELRKAQVKVETSRTSGLIIQKDSIVEQDGVMGVFVKDATDEFNFTPVNILDSDDNTAVVSASSFYDEEGNYVYTIDPFDDIMVAPEEEEEAENEEK